jgi:hypothetical protein
MFSEMLSGDAMALSIYRARRISENSGVSLAEFDRVSNILLREWSRRRGGNPLSGLF